MAAIACGKDNGTDGGNTPAETDANGIESVLIREKGKGGEFAKEINITIPLVEVSTSLEVKVTPESAADKLSFSSENEKVARVTRQGNIYLRGEGSTKINVSAGEPAVVYATANITITGKSDPGSSDDPGPVEKTVLGKDHWYFYCVVCDDFEPIAQSSAHSGVDEFATWYPWDTNIVLMEDTGDTYSNLEGPYDNQDFYPYMYDLPADTFFLMDEPGGPGTGLWFSPDPDTPYSGSGDDTFGSGTIELSFENDLYVSETYRPKGRFRGLVGWIDELQMDLRHENGSWSRNILNGNGQASQTISAGEKFRLTIMWRYTADKAYLLRSRVEPDFTIFEASSSNSGIVKVLSNGVTDGYWKAELEAVKKGSADVTISSHISRGDKGTKRTVHLTVE